MAERKLPTRGEGGTWSPATDIKGVYVLTQKRERGSQLSDAQKEQVTRAVDKVRQKIASLKVRGA